MNPAQKRLFDACLAHPPEHPNGDANGRFWKGYAFEAGAQGKPDDRNSLMFAAFEAGREFRRRGGVIPDRVRKALPNLFAGLV